MKNNIRKSMLIFGVLLSLDGTVVAGGTITDEQILSDEETVIHEEITNALEVSTNLNTVVDTSNNNIVGIKYLRGGYISNSDLNALGVRDKSPNTILREITIQAPINGYAVVSVSGQGCVHTDNEYIELMLSTNGKTFIPNNQNVFAVLGQGDSCAIDNYNASYSFRHIEPIIKGKSYSYYLLGHRKSTNKISANIEIRDMMVAVYPALP